MASTEQMFKPEVVPTSAPVRESRRRYVRYIAWGLILPAIAYFAAFPLVRTRGYESWGQTQYGPELEYPFSGEVPDADVVVFGDSSGFLGVDPRIVNGELGIRSVVLPSTVGSLPVIADAPLRNYVEHHAPPKLIVLYFSAWNLDLEHIAPGRMFEGEEMMLRHGRLREVLRFARRHPLELPAFPLRFYSTFGPKMLAAMLHGRNRAAQTAAQLGHADFKEPFPPLTDLCEIPREYLSHEGTATVEQLVRRYTTAQTKVMVYLAPIPECGNSALLEKRSFAAVGAAPPVVLPARYFAADPYDAHVLPPYVPVASRVFAEALRGRLPEAH